jgi:hypothetical protein
MGRGEAASAGRQAEVLVLELARAVFASDGPAALLLALADSVLPVENLRR